MKLKLKKPSIIQELIKDKFNIGELEESANDIDHGELEDMTVEKLTCVLEKILGKKFLKETLEYINLYPIEKYTENLHKFILQTIKLEFMKLEYLSNRFYESYSSWLNNDYQNYYEDDYETVNSKSINKAFAILKDIIKFKEFAFEISLDIYVGNSIDQLNNTNLKDYTFIFTKEQLVKTINLLVPSCVYFLQDKLKELKLYPTIIYSKELHEFILHIIKIELNKFKESNEDFYYQYTSHLNINNYEYYHDDGWIEDKLNFEVINYSNEYGINYKGINKAYLILHQLIDFKNNIYFNN